MTFSLCKGKSVVKPNKCKKVRGCKVATGKTRTFCRKTKNKTVKKNKSVKKSNTLKPRKGKNNKTAKTLKARS